MTPNTPVTEVLTSLSLPDGSLLERLGDHRLALSHHGEITIGEEITHGECVYRAGPLDSTLALALKLPLTVSRCEIAALFGALEKLFTEEAHLEEDAAGLLAASILSTWVADLIPMPLCVQVLGPMGTGARLKGLVSALVRSPLALTEVRIAELSQLPAPLHPTLILANLTSRTVQELRLAICDSGTYLLRKGRLGSTPRCSSFLFSTAPLELPSLEIRPASPNPGSLSSSRLAEIEAQMRPLLLGYRLANHTWVENCNDQFPPYSSETRILAQSLGAALAACPEAQARVANALRYQDDLRKSKMEESEPTRVLEAMVAHIHMEERDPHVQQITKLANLFLAARGEREMTDRAVGSIVRREFGLLTRRDAAGYRVCLSRRQRARLHHLAKEFGIPMPPNEAGCEHCDEIFFAEPDLALATAENEVQNVHKVHVAHTESLANDRLLQKLDRIPEAEGS